jgi:hypothetical protein
MIISIIDECFLPLILTSPSSVFFEGTIVTVYDPNHYLTLPIPSLVKRLMHGELPESPNHSRSKRELISNGFFRFYM